MGVPWIICTEEQEEAFRADWEMGMPLKELAALHGFKNVNSVTRLAKRLGLPLRPGGPLPSAPTALRDGRWASRNGIQVWIEQSA